MAGKTVRTAVAGPVNLLHKQKSSIYTQLRLLEVVNSNKVKTLEMTDYVLESRCCGTKFADEKWELDCPNRDGAALIFANYAKKQLEVKENLPGLYKYSDWLPVCRTLDGSGAPVTYKSEGLAGELGLSDL